MELKISLVSLMKVFKKNYVLIKVCVAGGPQDDGDIIEMREIIPGGQGRTGPDFLQYNLDTQTIKYIDSWKWENMIEAVQKRAKERLHAYQV